jgi:hypothetical protein
MRNILVVTILLTVVIIFSLAYPVRGIRKKKKWIKELKKYRKQ